MEISYRTENSGHTDSYEEGNKFQDFVCIELAKENIILQNINSKKFQFETGENLQGFEIKLDNRCTGANGTEPSNRLSIEIAEKTKAENQYFIDSGIYRDDNSWLYIQGNTNVFWIFSKKLLVMLHKSGKYNEYEQKTIKTFFLPIDIADKFCCKKIVIK